jgi:hypothetical protein
VDTENRDDREQAAKAWLLHLPEHQRGWMGNLFHAAARQGAASPAEIIRRVAIDASGAAVAPYIDNTRREHYRTFLDALDRDREGALRFAGWVLDYSQLPPEVRQALKDERDAKGRQDWMRTQPPTERQLEFLLGLGYTGAPPSDRQSASELIGNLKSEAR